jgi:hypothetical protein
MAPFYTPQLLLNDERMLVQVVRNKIGQTFSMNLDGTDAREFTRAGEGLPYGLSLSPDKRRVAYHIASPAGYQIWTSDLAGGQRIKIAGQGRPFVLRPGLVARMANGWPTGLPTGHGSWPRLVGRLRKPAGWIGAARL